MFMIGCCDRERGQGELCTAPKDFIFMYILYAKANVHAQLQGDGDVQSSYMLGRKKTIIRVVFLKF